MVVLLILSLCLWLISERKGVCFMKWVALEEVTGEITQAMMKESWQWTQSQRPGSKPACTLSARLILGHLLVPSSANRHYSTYFTGVLWWLGGAIMRKYLAHGI